MLIWWCLGCGRYFVPLKYINIYILVSCHYLIFKSFRYCLLMAKLQTYWVRKSSLTQYSCTTDLVKITGKIGSNYLLRTTIRNCNVCLPQYIVDLSCLGLPLNLFFSKCVFTLVIVKISPPILPYWRWLWLSGCLVPSTVMDFTRHSHHLC